MRTLATALAVLALGAWPALAQAQAPSGSSLDKVLVIGTDGTRWDLLRDAMRDGRAPNLARLARQGFARPSKLQYAPAVLTLSEVGWTSIASGVWPGKHGVDGRKFNMDPKQATKNGYLDFLTRIERSAPRISTYLASDWANLGLPQFGGPIFGTSDSRFAIGVSVETLEEWDSGDEQVTAAAERHLRRNGPDASFVYLGLVDESAHLVGSATPAYPAAIATTDARIGRVLRAVRSRPSYPFESWTVLVSTDHGQRPLDYPSLATHLSQTPLEITSFVLGAGPGLGRNVKKPRVVDIAPTVLHQLGVPVRKTWKLDGRTLSRASGSHVSASARKGRLAVSLRLAQRRAGARALVVRLPAGVRVTGAGTLDAHVNRRAAGGKLVGGRTIVIGVPGRKLRSLALTGRVSVAGSHGRTVKLAIRGASRGRLSVRLAGS